MCAISLLPNANRGRFFNPVATMQVLGGFPAAPPTPMRLDPQRLRNAAAVANRDLLAELDASGHWVGRLSSSALSTATAVSALSAAKAAGATSDAAEGLLHRGVEYIAAAQNDDGGWGDTDKSFSNIATTMLARAALHLAGADASHAGVLDRAVLYIEKQGGLEGLRRRYGKDKTFAVPILMNQALAGLVDWRRVFPLPFELACLPHAVLGAVRLPVVSYAIPALVAIGQARYFHAKPRNPIARLVRGLSVNKSLAVLERMQPASGGFLEAAPLTSFVCMSLASIGRADHPVVRRGLRFLQETVREDGSWAIDVNLATWLTTLSVNALGPCEELPDCLDWVLSCRHTEVHPFTAAAPGGWGWTDLSGSVPDADDTPGALLALKVLWERATDIQKARIREAVLSGVRWLLNLQNGDGGFPTFCRGWGTMPFDRGSTDLTAHAIRAFFAWRGLLDERTHKRVAKAITAGFRFLARKQQPDGNWFPLWFGNQYRDDEENPVYGTARVLLAYRDTRKLGDPAAVRGLAWLAGAINADGGWGGDNRSTSSVEETAVAVEALRAAENDATVRPALERGLDWLVTAVESGRHRETSPIGFYFAKLWYYERLYPLIFTAAALSSRVVQVPAAGRDLNGDRTL